MSSDLVTKATNIGKLQELAAARELEIKNTNDIIKYLVSDMILDLYRLDPEGDRWTPEQKKFNLELNQKIRNYYKEQNGIEWDDFLKDELPPPFCLHGAPGHGKTTAYVEACKQVCKLFDLNFVRNVEEDYMPKVNDFLFLVMDTAGKNSVIELAIPRAVEVPELNAAGEEVMNVYLKTALNWRFMCLNKSAGGILLFDDAANANIAIQNTFLQIALNRSFGSMKLYNSHIGFTGNLGAADNTYTNDFGSAFRNRVANVFVMDTPENFIQRAYKKYNTNVGDAGIIGYLARNKDDLFSLPQAGSSGGFNSSRSWDMFLGKVSRALHAAGGRGIGEEKIKGDVSFFARSLLGPVVGKKVSAFYDSMLLGADPLARDFVAGKYEGKDPETGKDMMEVFAKKYNEYQGSPGSDTSLNFNYQYGAALADYCTNAIRNKVAKLNAEHPEIKQGTPERDAALTEILKEIGEIFGKGTQYLGDTEYNFSLTHLKSKLAASMPEMGRMTDDGPRLQRIPNRELAFVLCKAPDITRNRQHSIASILADTDKMASAVFQDAESLEELMAAIKDELEKEETAPKVARKRTRTV